MNFIKPNLNSLPEQVDINTNDIKNLKSVLKSSYKTEKELETTAITIPITDTNAPQGTTSGWLYDSVGHLYSINGGDDTNLLLEYYTNLRGQQGVKGQDGDNGVSVETIENIGYTDGEGYTITHCKATLTNGNEEFFDVQAKQGNAQLKTFTTTNILIFYDELRKIDSSKLISAYFEITPHTDGTSGSNENNCTEYSYSMSVSGQKLSIASNEFAKAFKCQFNTLENSKIGRADLTGTYQNSTCFLRINSDGTFTVWENNNNTSNANVNNIQIIKYIYTKGDIVNLKITYLE